MQFNGGRRLGAAFVASLFVVGLLAIAPVSANPGVPSCGPASAAGGSSATMDAYDPALCEQLTGRVFPEAFPHDIYFQPDESGHANTGVATDYVAYFEFQQGLDYLANAYPDYIEVHEVAMSAGNDGASNPVYLLELTNENSPVPMEERQALLFMLSIHGNEKGGREGGFRVLEDLLKGISFGGETVQDGAGMPTALPRPTGEGNVETYQDFLDFQRIFLLFPNTDGWSCDELESTQGADACAGTFRRTNGNGVDLNRQAPTLGWVRQGSNSHESMKESEAVGYYTWMRENVDDWTYAIDIHGMLSHRNFGAIMLPAGGMTPLEMEKSLSLAETLKQRLNNDPHFDEWLAVMAAGEQATGPFGSSTDEGLAALCAASNDPITCFASSFIDDRPPSQAVGSSQFAEYYTVIDAIGYTDSGFNGDYFAQDTGLNAPGYDIELAYNHAVAGAQYEVGALWNDYHVKMVREITKSFMDAAALDIQVSFETGGSRTLYIEPSYIATNLDDESQEVPADSWAAQNPGDDLWQYSAENPFFATPGKYWTDLKPFVRDGDAPGVLVGTPASRLTAAMLESYDTLVIPGSSINQFLLTGVAGENDLKREAAATPGGLGQVGVVDEAKVQLVLDWVEAGGHLVLTDSALSFFDLSGLTTGAVDVVPRYMGGIAVDLEHPMLEYVRGGVKQMYEPTPLGFGTSGSSPNWFIDHGAFEGLGGSVAGRECGTPSLADKCPNSGVGLGRLVHGSGDIMVMGSLLPDPTEEFYHPYGLDHYATTYSGNQIMLNMLGWEKVYQQAPVVITDEGKILQTDNEPTATDSADDEGGVETGKKRAPGVGLLAVVGALAALAIARRKD